MSTILKALQRLEDEKRAKAELTLEEQIAMTQPPASRQRRGWLVLAGSGVAGIAVAVGAIFWVAPDSATEVESPEVAASPAPPRPVAPSPTAPGPAQLARPEPKAAPSAAESQGASSGASPESPSVSSKVEVVQRLSPPPKLDMERFSLVAPAVEPTVRERAIDPADSVIKDRIVALARNTVPKRSRATPPGTAIQSGVASTERGTATERSTIDKRSTADKSSAPTKSTSTKPAASTRAAAESEPSAVPPPIARAKPAMAPPPPQPPSKRTTGSAVKPDHKVVLRARLPELKVRSTIWHPQSSRRIAVVEIDAGQVLELNEGDAVGPLVVESIKPGGVFFTHDGVSVLHKVGR